MATDNIGKSCNVLELLHVPKMGVDFTEGIRYLADHCEINRENTQIILNTNTNTNYVVWCIQSI